MEKVCLWSILGTLCLIETVKCADFTDISRLRATILNNYDNLSRPIQNHQNATELSIYFLNSGFEFDEHRSMMTFHLVTVMSWEDQHVKWDPLSYGNLSEITFSAMELWRPDISVLNNYDNSEIDHFANTLMTVISDGHVWWIPPTKFQVGCPTDFKLWPYDKQTCSVLVASWVYTGGELDITVPENYTHLHVEPEWVEFLENREWTLLNSNVQRSFLIVYCCPEISLVEVEITVEIQRKSSAHYAAVTIVGLGIAATILISFWLDPFAHERIPLTLLVILLNAMYLQYMHRAIPNNGATVPLTIQFFRDSLVMVTFSLVWTVGIRYIAKTKRNSPVPLPEFVQTLLNSFLATLLCLNPRPTSKSQSLRKTAETSGEEDGDISELVREDDTSVQEDWEWLARLLDRIAFFSYLITYTVFIIAFL